MPIARIAIVTSNRADASRLEGALDDDTFSTQVHVTGRDAIREFSRDMPDLAILDTKAQGLDGPMVLSKLRGMSDIPVVVITDSGPDDVDELVAFRMGANDYVLKDASDHLIRERVRARLRRVQADRFPRDNVPGRLRPYAVGDIRIDPAAYSVTLYGYPVNLPRKGFALVETLARYPGRLLQREQLLEAMNFDPDSDQRLVDGHVKKVRRAFRTVDPEFDAIKTIYGLGYKLQPASDG